MDAAGLHDGLRTKLDHLETKLEAHRRDLLGQFHQHYHELTRIAAPSAVASIQDKLRATLDEYKLLRPSLPQQQHPPEPQPAAASAAAPVVAESPQPPVSDNTETATTSQTLSLAPTPADSGNLDPPGSPRDRDHELQGLFTPSYLPLLAALPTPADDKTASPAVTTEPAAIASQQSGSPNSADSRRLPATEGSIGNGTTSIEMDQSADPDRFPGQLATPPRHRPGETETADAATADDANSSASSDRGDNKAPRSALRRSSSIYKSPQSPRRVRFEFMGAEVLPTASPQASDNMMPRSSSPMWEGENVSVDSVLGGDTDDSGPPPKKISSSDALRALSREPLEDGTVWTVVNPDSDNITNKVEQLDLGRPPAEPEPEMRQIQQQHNNNAEAVADDSLDMKKTRAATPPPLRNPAGIASKAQSKNKAPLNDSNVRDDDDDMFQFEDEAGRTSLPRPPPAPAADDEQSEDENAAATSASASEPSTLRSPTTVAPAFVPVAKPEPPEPATPTTPRFHVGSVGSYKGRSIMMPVVKNPEVHAKAASIGNFTSFVGGLDGTSGMDAADLSSYRASFMRDGFSGTPRSFTERLMMEDMEAERLKEKTNP